MPYTGVLPTLFPHKNQSMERVTSTARHTNRDLKKMYDFSAISTNLISRASYLHISYIGKDLPTHPIHEGKKHWEQSCSNICLHDCDENENSFPTSNILFPAECSQDLLRPMETKKCCQDKT